VGEQGGSLMDHEGSTMLVGLNLNSWVQEGFRGGGRAFLREQLINLLEVTSVASELFPFSTLLVRLEQVPSSLLGQKVVISLDGAGLNIISKESRKARRQKIPMSSMKE
jgi:hypothetical protein